MNFFSEYMEHVIKPIEYEIKELEYRIYFSKKITDILSRSLYKTYLKKYNTLLLNCYEKIEKWLDEENSLIDSKK